MASGGKRTKRRNFSDTDIEILVGEVEQRKNTFGLFGRPNVAGSSINKKAIQGNNLQTKAYPCKHISSCRCYEQYGIRLD